MYYTCVMLVNLLLWAGYFFFILLLIGLVKPWYLLWWEDTQNRKRIIYIYGSITLFLLVAHFILSFFL